MLSLRVDQRRKGKRKGPYHRWRAFEIRVLLTHDTSRPALAVVVVVVEAICGRFMVLTVTSGRQVWQAGMSACLRKRRVSLRKCWSCRRHREQARSHILIGGVSRFCGWPKSPVGASLLAMAFDQSTLMSADRALSRAGSLPQVFSLRARAVRSHRTHPPHPAPGSGRRW